MSPRVRRAPARPHLDVAPRAPSSSPGCCPACGARPRVLTWMSRCSVSGAGNSLACPLGMPAPTPARTLATSASSRAWPWNARSGPPDARCWKASETAAPAAFASAATPRLRLKSSDVARSGPARLLWSPGCERLRPAAVSCAASTVPPAAAALPKSERMTALSSGDERSAAAP
eukprot:360294-Chlamydomonas_euryale.AAC.2